MSLPLLPQQIAPIARWADSAAARALATDQGGLEALFSGLRAETDRDLGPRLVPAGGQAYPYGRCEEITRDVFARLARVVERPPTPTAVSLREFLAGGGVVRTVWGVLRDTYFQNAIQIGPLYVDVANDTVVVTKPKVEILPMAESGLENIRDIAHFRDVAERYWKTTIHANTLTPSLAPLLPMISAGTPTLPPGFQSASDNMIALMCRDGFQQAEVWLADGPPPPPEVASRILNTVPRDLWSIGGDGRAEALAACRRARALECHLDGGWRDARVVEYLRIGQPRRPVT